MSGFDNAKVDEEFFSAGVEREAMCEEYVPGTIRSNFLCNIGLAIRHHCERVRLALTSKKPVTFFEAARSPFLGRGRKVQRTPSKPASPATARSRSA